MAVKQEHGISRYTGLSTDRKPLPGFHSHSGTDIPPGSSFLESDTGRIYRFNGVDWYPQADSAEVLNEIKTLLETLPERLAEVLSTV